MLIRKNHIHSVPFTLENSAVRTRKQHARRLAESPHGTIGRKVTFRTGAGFPHGNTIFLSTSSALSALLPRTAIQQNHGILIRKKLRGPLFHLICRNIQGPLLMSRAVLLRSSDIHQHNRARHAAFRRHHHGGGSRGAFRIPAFQPDEEGSQPGHHDHVQNHIFHAATSLNRGEVIKRK